MQQRAVLCLCTAAGCNALTGGDSGLCHLQTFNGDILSDLPEVSTFEPRDWTFYAAEPETPMQVRCTTPSEGPVLVTAHQLILTVM